ncbi:class I SAM-dependent methyltransferase [Halohasta salina]|uniref:class I SAM-dependent methyltransferase n=1 Tax=Halohasta salina TaxID=2961621 RepID=UPI0020A3EF9A|nr:methyltransferase [Halohasta salina]
MTTHHEFLDAKRTIEDRALNRRVFDRFTDALADRAAAQAAEPDRTAERVVSADPVRIVEVGAGTGSMVVRLADWEVFPPRVDYRAVDLDATTVDLARRRLPERLSAAGYTVDRKSDRIVARQPNDGLDRRLEISLEVGDGFAIDDEADAVIAAAVLDLVDLQPAVEDLKKLLADGGLLYAPFTFNGHTSFLPRDLVDDRIERLYHRHMDEVRDQPGSSRAGQRLLKALPAAGYTVLAAGGADWTVRPVDGEYPAAESTALDGLLSTIDGALADYPPDVIEADTRRAWIERRREQLARGELTLVAHHLDVLARL